MLTLAERQLEAAMSGNLGELGPLSELWDALVASMPAEPPAAAEPLLQRAAQLSGQTNAQLLRLHQTLVQDISIAARAGRAAHGYAAQAEGARLTLLERRA